MLYVVIGTILVLAVLLVFAILAQNSKGGGLSSQFGGSATQMIGVKKSSDLLEKVTWFFIGAIFVLTLSTSLMVDKKKQGEGLTDKDMEGIEATTPIQQEGGETEQPE